MKEYFIYNGQQEGPFNIEQLRSKSLTKETPVWYDGLNEWSTIGEIPELRSIVKATPPPFQPVIKSAPPPFQTAVQSDYEYQMEMEAYFPERKKTAWGTIALVAFIIVTFILLIQVLKTQ